LQLITRAGYSSSYRIDFSCVAGTPGAHISDIVKTSSLLRV
jgi:hypothetical protein